MAGQGFIEGCYHDFCWLKEDWVVRMIIELNRDPKWAEIVLNSLLFQTVNPIEQNGVIAEGSHL